MTQDLFSLLVVACPKCADDGNYVGIKLKRELQGGFCSNRVLLTCPVCKYQSPKWLRRNMPNEMISWECETCSVIVEGPRQDCHCCGKCCEHVGCAVELIEKLEVRWIETHLRSTVLPTLRVVRKPTENDGLRLAKWLTEPWRPA